MPPYFAWQALAGQGWPASAEQEKALVDDLRRAAPGNAPFPGVPRRTAVTGLLNALRCGSTYEQLTSVLPALDPAELAHAHDYLTTQLSTAHTHWARLIANPTAEGLATHGPTASMVLPVPVNRIAVLLHHVFEHPRVADSAAKVAAEVRRITDAAASIELKLLNRQPGTPTGIALGRSLHDVAEPGVWTHPYFLPVRVGQLSPTRVRHLYACGLPPEAADD